MGRPAPASYARRRRGRVGVGAQGRGEGPWAALGLSRGGRKRAGHGALLQAAATGGGGTAPGRERGRGGVGELRVRACKLVGGSIQKDGGRGWGSAGAGGRRPWSATAVACLGKGRRGARAWARREE